MLFYTIHYILLNVLSFFSSLKSEGRNKLFLPVIFILLFLTAALRADHVDRDYMVYFNKFSRILTNIDYFKSGNYIYYEPAFYFIPLFSKFIFGSYYVQMSFAIFAFLGVYFRFKSLYLSNSYFLSLCLYISSWFLLHEMTQIRVGVATGIVYYGLKYIKSREYLKYILCVIGGAFFHYTSVIFIIVLFLKPNSFSPKAYIVLLSSCLLLNIGGIGVAELPLISQFFPKMQEYALLQKIGAHDEINVFNLIFILHFVIGIVIILNYSRLKTYNEYLPILLKMYSFGLIVFLLTSKIPVVAHRVSELFMLSEMYLYPILIFTLNRKIVGYVLIILISFILHYNYMYKNILLVDYKVWI